MQREFFIRLVLPVAGSTYDDFLSTRSALKDVIGKGIGNKQRS